MFPLNTKINNIEEYLNKANYSLFNQILSLNNLNKQLFPEDYINNKNIEEDDFYVPLYISNKDRIKNISKMVDEQLELLNNLKNICNINEIDFENLDMALGDRMKLYEKKFQTYINEDEHMIIRLDGDSFSEFTKGFKKPFDKILTETMIRTTKDLFVRFSCSFAYTQSDEITLIIPKTKQMILGGKVQKIVSLSAGYCSTKFNSNLIKVLKENKHLLEKKYFDFIKNTKVGNAWFDSRLFGIKDSIEVFNAFLFRARDAERNSISMLGYANFSHNEMLNINSSEKKELMLSKNISWDDLDDGLKYGFCFKREQYINEQNAKRTKIKMFAKKFNFSEENVDLLLRKLY